MIQQMREDLVADLETTGYPAYGFWIEKGTASLPALFVVPPQGVPFIEDGVAFHEYRVRLDVVAVVSKGSRDSATVQTDLEQLVEAVLAMNSDWLTERVTVDSPEIVTVNGVEMFGTLIHLSRNTKL